MTASELRQRASHIRLLITDVDGVLTDNGVYYSDKGEELKRFSIRDGMGVERLRNLAGIETGIITGEKSGSVSRRAEKLQITELHLGVNDKLQKLNEVLERKNFKPDEIAFIGDDINDFEIMNRAGIAACPADAMEIIKTIAQFICLNRGGHGAFREFAEWLIAARSE